MPVLITEADEAVYARRFADCVILTKEGKILLQQRTPEWRGAGRLTAFGGHVESDETPIYGVMRELNEEPARASTKPI